MANRFWAATKIKFGKRTEDGSQEGKYEQIVFEPGEEVKGLSKEDMKGLWNAGALTQTEPEKSSEEEEKSSEEKSSEEDKENEGTSTPPTPPAKATPAKAAPKAAQQG